MAHCNSVSCTQSTRYAADARVCRCGCDTCRGEQPRQPVRAKTDLRDPAAQERRRREGGHFDPALLGDPVALETSFHPLRRSVTSDRTHALYEERDGRLRFRPTLPAIALRVLSIGIGSVFVAAGAHVGLTQLAFGAFLMVTLGLVGVCAGALMLGRLLRPIVLDRELGLFWKQWRTPRIGERGAVALAEVHAVQVLAKYSSGRHGRSYGYELNLVLHDGSRVNVVDEGDAECVRDDAESLSIFLDVPVWDPRG